MSAIDPSEILSSSANYDDIVRGLEVLESSADDSQFLDVASAFIKIFGTLAKRGELRGDSPTAQWLNEQLSDFWGILLRQRKEFAPTSFAVAFKVLLVKGKYLGDNIEPLISELVTFTFENQELFNYWPEQLEWDDLRYYFWKVLPKQISSVKKLDASSLVETMAAVERVCSSDNLPSKFYIPEPPKKVRTLGSLQLQAQGAWLAVLRLPMNRSTVKEVLTVLHARIIPAISKPQVLMDFLVSAYDHGGSVALLALDGIFVLMQYHRLEYPHFFTKLYSLLEDGSLLVSAHRGRFLRLLALFLTSSHLPAAIVASILKRLSRLALFAPPGAIVAIIPFVYNQMKRTPTCILMIHRTAEIQGVEADPFDFSEKDPLQTQAIESSLWELQALTNHYHPNVSALAKIFEQPMTKPGYQLDHFLAHSYDTLFATAANRKSEAAPLEFEEVKLFEDVLETWGL